MATSNNSCGSCDDLKFKLAGVRPPLKCPVLPNPFLWVLAAKSAQGPWCWYAMNRVRSSMLTMLAGHNMPPKSGGQIYCPEAQHLKKGGTRKSHLRRRNKTMKRK